MEAVMNTQGTNLTYKGVDRRGQFTLYIAHDVSNCKLSYLHGCGCLREMDDDTFKQVINEALKYLKGCVIMNTTVKEVADHIAKLYEVYYYKTPNIGYNDGYQYHVCFRNSIRLNASCRTPEGKKVVKAEIPKDYLSITDFKKLLIANVKGRRRKTDWIAAFIESLKK